MTNVRGLILQTDRLVIRRLTRADAPFMVALLNEPSFLRFIGDRGVRTEADARAYLRNGPLASYAQHGFGLYLVVRKADAAPIGICGLLRREGLEAPDIGFALRPLYWAQGYAGEAARAVLDYGRSVLGLTRIVAIVAPGNGASARLLTKLGFHLEGTIRLGDDDLHLFGTGPSP